SSSERSNSTRHGCGSTIRPCRTSRHAVVGRCGSQRRVLIGVLVALGLLMLGELSLAVVPVHVTIEVRGSDARVSLDGSQHDLRAPDIGPDARVRLEQPGPAAREYQIDGSDTTSRNDRDVAQFLSVSDSLGYRVLAWLRDEGSYSRWEDVRLVDLA